MTQKRLYFIYSFTNFSFRIKITTLIKLLWYILKRRENMTWDVIFLLSQLYKFDFLWNILSMLENNQRYLVEISQIEFRSEEVFNLTSENVTPWVPSLLHHNNWYYIYQHVSYSSSKNSQYYEAKIDIQLLIRYLTPYCPHTFHQNFDQNSLCWICLIRMLPVPYRSSFG